MTNISNFRTAAQQSPANSRVLQSGNGQVVATRGGVSWFQTQSQKSENKQTAEFFLKSIRSHYGEKIAGDVAPLIAASLERGKPLHSRQVVRVLNTADEIRPKIIQANRSSIEGFFKEVATGQGASRFDMKFNSTVKEYFGKDANLKDIKDMVNFDALKSKVAIGLDQMRMEGRNLISNEDIIETAGNLIVADFQAGLYEQCEKKVDLKDVNSLASQVLDRAIAQQGSELKLDKLTPVAREQLQSLCNTRVQKLLSESIRAIDTGGNAPNLLEGINDGSIVKALDSTIQKFVADRTAVYKEVVNLPATSFSEKGETVNPQEMWKLAEAGMHGTLSTEQVRASGTHRMKMLSATTELSELLLNPVESRQYYSQLGACLKNIQSMTAEVDLGNAHEQNNTLKDLWSFALASKTPEEINNLKNALTGTNSKIPSLLKGLKYMEGNFSNYEDCQNDPQAYRASQKKASECNAVLSALSEHLDENAVQDKTADFTTLEDASDTTIALMRNIGLEVPAPNRLGSENPDAIFSDRTYQKIQKNVANLSNIGTRPKIIDGMYEESTRDFHRASYKIDGQIIPRGAGIDSETTTAGVKDALIEMCSDENNNVIEPLLLSVSKIACQALPGCGLTSIYGMSDPDLLLFRPGLGTTPQNSIEYEISRNDKGGIDVSVASTNIATVATFLVEGYMDQVMLDRDKSYANLTMRASVGPNGEGPTLEDISYGYSLKPMPDEADAADMPDTA
ncbi:MAG: hypothetical protein ACNYNY_05530 [Candidatus Oxydemutatoraceae bacterium WSBS_2016_MAG_OTU14]